MGGSVVKALLSGLYRQAWQSNTISVGDAPRHAARSMLRRTRITGFTLVELLIVVGIIGLTLSLVGPLTVNQLDSAKRTQEREQFHRHLQQWKFNATHWRLPVELELEGRHLRVYNNPRPQQEPELLAHYEYEQLRFPTQHIGLNAHGYWSQTQIEWYEGSQDAVREKALVNRGVVADAY